MPSRKPFLTHNPQLLTSKIARKQHHQARNKHIEHNLKFPPPTIHLTPHPPSHHPPKIFQPSFPSSPKRPNFCENRVVWKRTLFFLRARYAPAEKLVLSCVCACACVILSVHAHFGRIRNVRVRFPFQPATHHPTMGAATAVFPTSSPLLVWRAQSVSLLLF